MSSEPVIRVEGVTKRFRIHRTPARRIANALTFGLAGNPGEHWALKGVDMEIRRGETVGLLGANGSGKSTLLQMVAGTMTPTGGRIEIGGRVAALLELGAGFNPDFTGRQNALLSIRLLAPDEADPAERMAWIERFAEIGHHIDAPVRTYSSGMFVRLAFAVVASVRPDVLLVDEALAVGDASFQEKCYRFMREGLGDAARLVVSHDLAAISATCDRVCVLAEGRIVYDGPVGDGINEHLRRCNAGAVATGGLVKSGPREIDILGTRLLVSGRESRQVRAGDLVEVEVEVESSLDEVAHGVVGMVWMDRLGQWVMADNSQSVPDAAILVPPGRSTHRVGHAWPAIRDGEYILTPGVGQLPFGPGSPQRLQCWVHGAHALTSVGARGTEGLVQVEMRVGASAAPVRSMREVA